MVIFVLAYALAQPPAPSAADENALARGALDAFSNKCVQCHGPQVAHPKARFGFVTDLEKLVASGKYVVPGKLEKSEVWQEIDEGDMPPDNAKAGPLSPQEVDAIRQWIVAGAPMLHAESGSGGAPAVGSQPVVVPAGPSERAAHPAIAERASPGERAVVLLGRLHVLAVHFPLALLLTAAAVEVVSAVRRSASVSPSVRVCLSLGAVGAMSAAALGWVHATDGFPGPFVEPLSTAGLHRWLGTAAAVAAVFVAALSELDVRRGARLGGVRVAIVLLALLVGAAGHFGGLLTHGAGYFDP